MSYENAKRGPAGFSFVEMIVVVAILGVLLGIAIPTYVTLVPSADLKADGRKIMFAMQRARQVASNYNRPTRVLLDCTAETLKHEGRKNPCRLGVELAVYDDAGVVRRWVDIPNGKVELNSATVATYKSLYTAKREQYDYYKSFFHGFYSVSGSGPRTYGVCEEDGFAGDSVVVVYVPSGEAVTYSKVSIHLTSDRKPSLPGWHLEVINSTGNVRLQEESA
jgi:prepilin-type N-terminal cleavage/methylation domain-containing protein